MAWDPVCDRAFAYQDGDLDLVYAATPKGPRVADQCKENWLGVTPTGRIGMANGRGEFTGPIWWTLRPTGHSSSHIPTNWLPMRYLHGVGWEAGGYPRVLNPLTLPEAKGSPSSRFPNLYGMVTHMGIRNPPGFTPGNFQSTCTTQSPDQDRPSTTTVTWLVTQAYHFLPHLGWLSLLWTIPRTIRCLLDSVIQLHQLRMNVMTRYPHNQV